MVLGLLDEGQSRDFAKLTIKTFRRKSETELEDLEEFKVPFNPNSYTIRKSVTWNNPSSSPEPNSGAENSQTHKNRNAPPIDFGGGGCRELTLNLFFDVTENKSIQDVRELTNKIVGLTRIVRGNNDGNEWPPVCEISWGEAGPKGSDFPFKGVVTSLNQDFTLFGVSGKPLRANLTVSFKEYLTPEEDERDTDPEITTRTVKRGDTLSSISADVYDDPSLWRIIAEENHLNDPRRLEVGEKLTIPKL